MLSVGSCPEVKKKKKKQSESEISVWNYLFFFFKCSFMYQTSPIATAIFCAFTINISNF